MIEIAPAGGAAFNADLTQTVLNLAAVSRHRGEAAARLLPRRALLGHRVRRLSSRLVACSLTAELTTITAPDLDAPPSSGSPELLDCLLRLAGILDDAPPRLIAQLLYVRHLAPRRAQGGSPAE